jgi:hypothetical protein
MARGKYIKLEDAYEQKRLIKQFREKYPNKMDRQALDVEVLTKSDIRSIV